MDPTDYFGIIISLVLGILFAVFFYRVGDIEYEKGLLFGSASLAVSLAATLWLHQGIAGVVGGQLLLFGGMWIFNLKRRA